MGGYTACQNKSLTISKQLSVNTINLAL